MYPIEYDDRRATRREFVQSVAAVSALAAVGLGSVGCGQATRHSTGPTAQLSAGKEITTPPATRSVSQATWAISSEPGSLDWILDYDPDSNTVLANVTESLLQMTPDFRIQPALAESYEQPDPLTWNFHIRPGVRFHDGSELTADDVVYSLQRNLRPSSYWNVYTSTIADIRRSSANTVTVRLKQPDALFLWLMTLPVGAVGKASYIEHAGKAYGTPTALPIGTGPLSVNNWQSGRQINLKRHEAYWDAAHATKVDNLTIVFIGNDADLTQSLLSGDVHGTYAAPASSVPVLESGGPGSLYRGRCLHNVVIIPTQRQGPLLNPQVRLAWSLAIDRPSIATKVWNGTAVPLRALAAFDTWGPLASDPSVRQAYLALPGAEPNLAKARQLLNAAGAKGQHVTLTVQNDSLSQNTALLLSEAADQIGLHVTIKLDTIQNVLNLFYDAKARESTDGFYYVDYSDVPHPLDLNIQYMSPPSPTNYNYAFHNAAAGQLVEKARRTEDQKKQTPILLEIQHISAYEAPHIPIVAPANLLYMNKAITGAPASFVQYYYPWARDLGAA